MPLPNARGVKRKRPNEEPEDKLRRKLHHALREVRKIVKKARTFEVQRTLKKLKEARRSDPESGTTRNLEAQMEVLKRLNYDQLAQSALMSKLKKDRTLSANPTIRTVSGEMATDLMSPGTLSDKVRSRVLSSKVLAAEVMSVVETLRAFLHPTAGLGGIEDAASDFHVSPNTLKKRKTGTSHRKGVSPSKDSGVVDPSGGRSGEEYENTSGDEAAAEADDGWESGTVGAPSVSDDSMVGAADTHDESSEANLPSEGAQSTISRGRGPKGQSEFLPSLSVGFTGGDTDSEFSDSGTKFVDGIKKNRRGQRARRAIWEKRFGKDANHIKKQRQYTGHRQPDSVHVDRRSGKGSGSSRPRRAPIQPRVPAYGHRPTSRMSEDAKNPKNLKASRGLSGHIRHQGDDRRKQSEPLHPSWEAKRKQKSANIVPSEGTKVIFSE